MGREQCRHVCTSVHRQQLKLGANGYSGFGYIGTQSNHALNIYTNNTSRIHITNTGKVGIGNTVPGYLFDVKDGDINTNHYLRITAWPGYGSGNASFWYDGNTGELLKRLERTSA